MKLGPEERAAGKNPLNLELHQKSPPPLPAPQCQLRPQRLQLVVTKMTQVLLLQALPQGQQMWLHSGLTRPGNQGAVAGTGTAQSTQRSIWSGA